MNIIILIAAIAVILVVGPMLFIRSYRRAVRNILATAWNIACGIGNRIVNFFGANAPAIGGVIGMVIRWLLILSLLILVALLVVYLLIAIGIITIGFTIGHAQAAFVFLFSFSAWRFLSLISREGSRGSIASAGRWIARPIAMISFALLVITGSWWTVGQIFPQFHENSNRVMENQSTELADFLNGISIRTEGKAGKIGLIDTDGVVGYSADGMKYDSIPKGTKVRLVTEIAGGKPTKSSEGMVLVMVENQNGDFIAGREYFIPPRKVNWDWNKIVPAPAAQAAVAEVTQQQDPPQAKPCLVDLNGEWILTYEKPEGYEGRTQQRSFSLRMFIRAEADRLQMNKGSLVFIGEKTREGYSGFWTESPNLEGKFDSLVFSENSATGCIITSDGTKMPMQLRRI